MDMKQRNKDLLMFLVALAMAIPLSVVFWSIGREINYLASYEDQVKETVCEMVKPEHLIKPCKKSN